MMDLKEKAMGNVMVMLSAKYGSDDLRFIQSVLVTCLQDFNFEQKRDLPSNDIIDNEKILRHYIATKKLEGLSEKSLKTYIYHLKKFSEFTKIDLITVDTNTVRYYLATLGIKSSKTYVDHVRRVLNVFYEFCKDEGYISVNPVKKIKHIKQDKTIKLPYIDTEVEMIRDACQEPRERALVSFLFSTGARRDEVCKVKMSDINFHDRSVILHGKGRKDRIVYFSARCEKHLLEYVNSKNFYSEYLFCSLKCPHGQLSNGALAQIVKKIGEKSGVGNVHLHRFRRWFGTYMANQGIPLQDLKEMMGHSKIETTNDYYVKSNMERIRFNYKSHAA